jgi:hypothetical protein
MRALPMYSVVCMVRLLLITAACCIAAGVYAKLAGCAVCLLTDSGKYYHRRDGVGAVLVVCGAIDGAVAAAAWSVCRGLQRQCCGPHRFKLRNTGMTATTSVSCGVWHGVALNAKVADVSGNHTWIAAGYDTWRCWWSCQAMCACHG